VRRPALVSATVVAAIVALAAGGSSALAASSSNWAGYAVTAAIDPSLSDGAQTPFTSVAGSWVQPTASCSVGSPSYSAFWVGLGGFSESSQALEQIGTEADCTASGRPGYRARYELVPAAPVAIKLKVLPGDTLRASVAIGGQAVTLRIRNVTRKTVFTRTLTMSAPDVSSAEWIAEAPSACNGFGRCEPLPLTNFGTVAFSSASATAGGHTGTISDPGWAATAVELDSTAGGFFRDRFARDAIGANAVPAALSADGSGFAISWLQGTGPTATPPDPYVD
jgi:hypothetical protein